VKVQRTMLPTSDEECNEQLMHIKWTVDSGS
jgi:hypothetical protein